MLRLFHFNRCVTTVLTNKVNSCAAKKCKVREFHGNSHHSQGTYFDQHNYYIPPTLIGQMLKNNSVRAPDTDPSPNAVPCVINVPDLSKLTSCVDKYFENVNANMIANTFEKRAVCIVGQCIHAINTDILLQSTLIHNSKVLFFETRTGFGGNVLQINFLPHFLSNARRYTARVDIDGICRDMYATTTMSKQELDAMYGKF